MIDIGQNSKYDNINFNCNLMNINTNKLKISDNFELTNWLLKINNFNIKWVSDNINLWWTSIDVNKINNLQSDKIVFYRNTTDWFTINYASNWENLNWFGINFKMLYSNCTQNKPQLEIYKNDNINGNGTTLFLMWDYINDELYVRCPKIFFKFYRHNQTETKNYYLLLSQNTWIDNFFSFNYSFCNFLNGWSRNPILINFITFNRYINNSKNELILCNNNNDNVIINGWIIHNFSLNFNIMYLLTSTSYTIQWNYNNNQKNILMYDFQNNKCHLMKDVWESLYIKSKLFINDVEIYNLNFNWLIMKNNNW